MLSVAGIVLSLFGTIFTLWEWAVPYSGAKYNHERDPLEYGIDPVVDGALPTETNEYRIWKKRRSNLIRLGIALIGLGAFMQILAIL